ncbi:hypothetical protein BGZ76_005000, partial [Entomortierella beljakovae]
MTPTMIATGVLLVLSELFEVVGDVDSEDEAEEDVNVGIDVGVDETVDVKGVLEVVEDCELESVVAIGAGCFASDVSTEFTGE